MQVKIIFWGASLSTAGWRHKEEGRYSSAIIYTLILYGAVRFTCFAPWKQPQIPIVKKTWWDPRLVFCSCRESNPELNSSIVGITTGLSQLHLWLIIKKNVYVRCISLYNEIMMVLRKFMVAQSANNVLVAVGCSGFESHLGMDVCVCSVCVLYRIWVETTCKSLI
jgi:hypothetical protein